MQPKNKGVDDDVDSVDATVFACIPEFELVMVRTADNYQYALTTNTAGVALASLSEGQRLRCAVTRHLGRVLSATTLATTLD